MTERERQFRPRPWEDFLPEVLALQVATVLAAAEIANGSVGTQARDGSRRKRGS